MLLPLFTMIKNQVSKRAPDKTIGPDHDPYMRRWYILPHNPWFNVYLHQILRSDRERELHDHPWDNWSYIVEGAYYEHQEVQLFKNLDHKFICPFPLWKGKSKFRKAEHKHRIEIMSPVWSIFIIGPKKRDWGFWQGDKFIPWQEFVNAL